MKRAIHICGGGDANAPLAKTLSFAVLHFTIAFTVAYLLTGSLLTGGLIALIEPACNTIAFYFHEKLWSRRGGKRGAHVGHGHGNLVPTGLGLPQRRRFAGVNKRGKPSAFQTEPEREPGAAGPGEPLGETCASR